MCTSNGKYRVRREKITKDASLIAIYRAKECNDLIPLIYDVLHKIDLDENRKLIKKVKKSFFQKAKFEPLGATILYNIST